MLSIELHGVRFVRFARLVVEGFCWITKGETWSVVKQVCQYSLSNASTSYFFFFSLFFFGDPSKS